MNSDQGTQVRLAGLNSAIVRPPRVIRNSSPSATRLRNSDKLRDSSVAVTAVMNQTYQIYLISSQESI